jgi:quaternary ammonium compound-resistance protein SugE
MAWLFILFADVFEVSWPFVLKSSAGFSKWSPLLAVALFTPSAFLLGYAVKQLPAATVYAAFTGIATAGTAIIGMAFFGESANAGRVCCLLLILIGVIGLKLFSGPVG